jgi:hypothetical protein
MATRGKNKTNDGPHKTLRKRLIADLTRRPGQPCARCGLPMYVTQLLDLDHTDDRAGYLGLSHRACNRRDGQAKTTAILKAKGQPLSQRQLRAVAAKRRRQTWQVLPLWPGEPAPEPGGPAPGPPRASRAW